MVDEWTSLYNSGETVETSHSWSEEGTYEIRVKAQDEYGAESDWSDPLPVSMPKTYENLFQQFFEGLFDWILQIFGINI